MNLSVAAEKVEELFGVVLEATALASVLILVIAVVQWLAGKPRFGRLGFLGGLGLGPSWRFALWGIVLVRLLVPIAPESRFSLFNVAHWAAPTRETVAPEGVLEPAAPAEWSAEAQVMAAEGKPFVEDAPVAIEATGVLARPGAKAAAAEIRWRRVAGMVWFAGAIWFLGRLVVGSGWLRRQLRKEVGRAGISVETTAILNKAARDLKTGAKFRLVESELVSSPALFGLLRPRLLVPVGFAEKLTAAELRHVFLHELAHLKRRDLLTNWLTVVAQAVHWFNPLVWFAFRQMRVERELACDEMVLRATCEAASGAEESRAYGETILRLLEGVANRRGLPALVGIAEEKHSARKRILQIVAFDGKRRGLRMLGVVLVAVLGVGGLTNAQIGRVETGKQENAEKILENDQARTAEEEAPLKEPVAKVTEEAQKGAAQDRDEALVERLEETPRNSDTPPKRVSNKVYSHKGRQAVMQKLHEILIERYEVPNGLKLSEVIKDVHAMARKLDGEKKGVNFIFSSHSENLGITGVQATVDPTSGRVPVKVGDYEVTISPALRDVTLKGLLDAIMEVAVPPKGSEGAPGLKYSVEDYAVVIGQRARETEPLYTRTFQVNPNTFAQGLDSVVVAGGLLQGSDGLGVSGGPLDQSEAARSAAMLQAVREFFVRAGVDFGTNQVATATPGGAFPPPPQKAIFYNDRTGVLMVRATRRDLELVEKGLQALNTHPPLVMVRVQTIELQSAEELNGIVEVLAKIQGKFRPALTTVELRRFKEAVNSDPFLLSKGEKQGALTGRAARQRVERSRPLTFADRVRVTTVSGRSAHVGIHGEPMVEVNAEYLEGNKSFKIAASNFDSGGNRISDVQQGRIYDGQTFILMPKVEKGQLKPNRISFLTAELVDGAGNRILDQDGAEDERTPPQE